MRFVWAVAAFILAAVMIGAGIAQRTVLLGDDSITEALPGSGSTAFTLVDGAVLGVNPGSQGIEARADGKVFLSYARSADLSAWLSDVPYTHVSVAADGTITSEDVAATVTREDVKSHSPVGSDLWLDEFTGESAVYTALELNDDYAVLVASDGKAPAPADIKVTWPIDNSTPWAGPLIVGGAILILVGILLYILGIRHMRRSRGPRRKALPPLPETEPLELSAAAADKGVITSGRKGRRKALTGRRGLVAAPAVLVTGALMAGCSPSSWPQFAESPTPSPSATVIIPEGQKPPGVTKAQAQRILSRVADSVAEADKKKDATAAAVRLDGPVLAERKTNYKLQKDVKGYKALPPIASSPLAIVLPAATDVWPRSVMTVVQDPTDTKVAPTVAVLTQKDPWSNYKLTYLADVGANVELPDLAPADVGAAVVPPDSSFLLIAPDQLAAAYADVVNKGTKSEYYALFEDNDAFLKRLKASNEEILKDFNKTGKETGTISFTSKAGSSTPVALATVESGAIVAVSLEDSNIVKPTNDEAVIKLDKNPNVKALAGVEESAKGFQTSYSDQLVFYVPGEGSTDKIRVLGDASNLLNAKELK